LPKSNTAPKTIDKQISRKAISVVVTLASQDYKHAIMAAKSSHETLEEWVSSLVHTALQP
jgi:hypothetical protein